MKADTTVNLLTLDDLHISFNTKNYSVDPLNDYVNQ